MKARLSGDYLVAEGLDDHVFGAAVQLEYDASQVFEEVWLAYHFCFYTARCWPTYH